MRVNIAPAIKPRVCILGGTGFVGRHLAAVLAEHRYRVRIPTRHSERHRDLRVLPGIDPVQADIHRSAELQRVLHGCDAVVNLVGILNERVRGDFDAVHVKLPRSLVHACEETGGTRMLHMSALNAGPGPSRYLKTKGEGEAIVHAENGLNVTSFRPSVIFGPDDHFFNRFGRLLKMSPLLFPLACPEARFAPVYVGDVVNAMLAALENPDTIGRRYELCGPHRYTLRQLVEYTADVLDLRRRILPLGDGLSRLQARIMGRLPGKPFTLDNYLSMRSDAICSGSFPAEFEYEPSAVESIVPLYLGHSEQRRRFDEYRRGSRHVR